jgi:uroporphyrin-III C-methyltransferase / precorrin-2 dehydrogenase / sirohydrochlorin ferrochelatase
MHVVTSCRPPSEGPPARIAPLAILPVFLRLQGRKAVVAGGSAAAAWKAELLAAAGAEVHVFATQMSEPLCEAIGNGSRIVHHRRRWAADCLPGAALAIADAEDDAEAQAFVLAARRAGVPVNIIDKPDHCDFQFGSIVNRSPVVVGISTDGAAPILGQAIRRRIETLLPPFLAGWGAIARSVRDTVAARLAPGAERRAFWDDFVARAFARPPAPDEAEVLIHAPAMESMAGSHTGRVTLVGAGPGDAELLTLKAIRALQSADVILFDDLVSCEVLELSRREARRMLVGKRGGRPSCRQEDINATMIALARAGRHVVRLKSGDPMIFGRAGEEIAELQGAGIAVDIVPGVTSALAMAARLKVSLTHRDSARAVRFVTAHSHLGGLPADIDWHSLADAATTSIFYMGRRTAALLADRLIREGLPATTPAVVAVGLCGPRESAVRTTLGSLAETVADLDADQPMLIGVGQVFANADCMPAADPTEREMRDPDAQAIANAGVVRTRAALSF